MRPHDLVINTEPHAGTTAAKVERVLRLGFEVRVEVCVDEEEPVSVQLSASEAEPLYARGRPDGVPERRSQAVARRIRLNT